MPPSGLPFSITILGAVPASVRPLSSPPPLRTISSAIATTRSPAPATNRPVLAFILSLLSPREAGKRRRTHRSAETRRAAALALGLGGAGRWALGEPEGDQQAAGRREAARRLWQGRRGDGPRDGRIGDPFGEADDRLTARVAPEQEERQESKQRQDRQKESAKLGHGGQDNVRPCAPDARTSPLPTCLGT